MLKINPFSCLPKCWESFNDFIRYEKLYVGNYFHKKITFITHLVRNLHTHSLRNTLTGLVALPLVISLAWVIQVIAPLLIPCLIVGGTIIDYLRCTLCHVSGNEQSLKIKMGALFCRLQLEAAIPHLYLLLSATIDHEKGQEEAIDTIIKIFSKIYPGAPNRILERAAHEIFTEWKRRQQEDTRPVFLFLRADAIAIGTIFSQASINDIDQLTSRYRCVFINDITSVSDIDNGLKRVLSPIQHIWLVAHGSPDSIALGAQTRIDHHTIDRFVHTFSDRLTPDATLILSSCKTAQARGRGENIATMLSRRLPGHTVFAATDSVSNTKIILGEDLSIRAKFHLPRTRLNWLVQKFRSLFPGRGHRRIKRLANVTTTIISHN
jgi:hypothetical protein